jgi:glycosyltransferase involved in cell wall biosynthesis
MGVTSLPDSESRKALRERYGFGPQDFLLASVSTLSSRKRLEVVLGAVRDARERAPGVRFLIVGGGALGARARNLISQLGLQDAVIQTGWVSAEQYRDYLSLADAVIDLRDISGAETANSLLRAIAAGLPAIVPGEGPFLELPDAACIKLPLGDGQRKALADAVAELCEDPSRRDEMARAAREYGQEGLDLKETAIQYMEFIEELALQPAAHPPLRFPPAPSAPMALAVSAVYKLFRIAFLYRQYGVSDTLKRVASELRTRFSGGT